MSDLISEFNPSASTSGSFVVTYLSNGIGKLIFWNDSAWSLDLIFPDGTSNIAPAWCAMIYELTGPAGSVQWSQDAIANVETPDLSRVWVIAFRDNEELPGTYPIALTRQTKQGGGTATVTVTSGNITVGSVTGTVTVSGTITVTAISSTVTVTGAVTVSGSVSVSNSLTIGSITNAVTVTGAITVSNALTIGTVSTTVPIETSGSSVVNVGTVAGTVNVAGSVAITNSSINIGTVTGNVTVVGTINVGTMPAITIAAAQSVNIGTLPAINIAAAQSVNIGTLPAVTIAAAQSVNIGNTPSVSIASGTVSVSGSQINVSGNINGGNPIFSATIGFGYTVNDNQVLNISNPSGSGKTCTFYSIREFTTDVTMPTANILCVPGANLALTTSVPVVSHQANASPPTSVCTATAVDGGAYYPNAIIETLDCPENVTQDFLDFPDIIILSPGNNLLVQMRSGTPSHIVRLTMKWSEA